MNFIWTLLSTLLFLLCLYTQTRELANAHHQSDGKDGLSRRQKRAAEDLIGSRRGSSTGVLASTPGRPACRNQVRCRRGNAADERDTSTSSKGIVPALRP